MDTSSRRSTNVVAQRRADPGTAGAEDERMSDAFARMEEEGHRFQFSQVMRLLERAFPTAPTPGETSAVLDPPVRLRPSVDLVFPPTDVDRVDWVEDRPEQAEVVLNFMGLYGIDSPLPYYFYEELAHETRETIPHRDFLDMFNHRFYAFFYRAWKKYRPYLHYQPGGTDRHSQRFVALAGLGTPDAAKDTSTDPMRLAAQAGTLGPRVRNAQGLEALIRAVFDGVEVSIIENVPRWVPIPSQNALGEGGLRLGENATIGEEVYDRSSKFRIQLGPLEIDLYRALLPGGDRAAELHSLVRLYAPDHLKYDVELNVPSDDLPATELGAEGGRLGLTTSLGTPEDPVVSRIVEYE